MLTKVNYLHFNDDFKRVGIGNIGVCMLSVYHFKLLRLNLYDLKKNNANLFERPGPSIAEKTPYHFTSYLTLKPVSWNIDSPLYSQVVTSMHMIFRSMPQIISRCFVCNFT